MEYSFGFLGNILFLIFKSEIYNYAFIMIYRLIFMKKRSISGALTFVTVLNL